MKRTATAALAVVLLATAGCTSEGGGSGSSGASVPGVTDSEIVVGTHMPLTGPAAAGYSKIAPATKAYFDYVNANGGVHGRKISYKIKDDGYNPANTQTVVRELVLQDKVFAILNGLGTPTHTGVLDFLKTNRVPDLFVASGSRSWNQPDKYPGTFGFNPDYTVEGKILGTYVKENLAGKKTCFLGQDDDFGRDSLAGIEKILGPVAAKESYVTSNPNVGPQMGALKAAGCEVVVLATVPGFTALSIGTAAKIAFKPQFVVSNVGADPTTVGKTLGAAAPLMEGLVAANYLPLNNDDANPWIQLFKKVNAAHNGNAEFDNNVVYGMSVGYLFVQALQAAGKDLTRDKIIEAVQKNGFQGPGSVPLRFSAQDHSGYGGEQLTKIQGGKAVYFGTPYTTDDKDGPVAPYTGQPVAPPQSGVPAA
ncbi:ABC-type branched-subunit amino acid transport system substrate-binding protein [Actinoplanes campanulatus]|uniref:ABC-type branched-subunit amino acid transport system substrate-binding protein n=1 Tax=Actinoplanes campanulatus TaxID=113559 RepID=A0A7W5AJA4_9ACTN|nr:ABC transporter substrate-binding protein [Actinoplanes campanulatus]MBB3097306.1 ABC-type branched-subunit amino acid transport system substrate-binding protein [Actinoplanes campanulatus]GGN17153.1 ABC transporter substrate-binding protein [Actinoplanes campanulatus]GID37511.1 ABC transporter substrate-binding protein [Actinoplanes campanulatus]